MKAYIILNNSSLEKNQSSPAKKTKSKENHFVKTNLARKYSKHPFHSNLTHENTVQQGKPIHPEARKPCQNKFKQGNPDLKIQENPGY